MTTFGAIEVGDHLVWQHVRRGKREGPIRRYTVTDKWFDPVAGWDDEKMVVDNAAGVTVAIRRVLDDGSLAACKERLTVNGLAVNGFQPSMKW